MTAMTKRVTDGPKYVVYRRDCRYCKRGGRFPVEDDDGMAGQVRSIKGLDEA